MVAGVQSVVLVYLLLSQARPPAQLGMVGYEWSLLINKSVQRELRFTPEQITKVQARIEQIRKEK